MNFKEFLTENSLYADAASKDTLMANNELLMDSLFFNYFGFLGLFLLNDKRGAMKTYETSEGKLYINNIGDVNHDVSLAVKMAYDAKLIPQSVTNKMTKLLQLIKSKTIKGKDLDEAVVRDYLNEIKYDSNKPSPSVLAVVNAFHTGSLSLPALSRDLYTIAKKKGYKPITVEFRDLVMKGQYLSLFPKANTTPNPTTATDNSNLAVTLATPPYNSDHAFTISTTGGLTKKGVGVDFIRDAFNAISKVGLQKVFVQYGVAESTPSLVDFNTMKTLIKASNIQYDLKLSKSPFRKWLKSAKPDLDLMMVQGLHHNTLKILASNFEINAFNKTYTNLPQEEIFDAHSYKTLYFKTENIIEFVKVRTGLFTHIEGLNGYSTDYLPVMATMLTNINKLAVIGANVSIDMSAKSLILNKQNAYLIALEVPRQETVVKILQNTFGDNCFHGGVPRYETYKVINTAYNKASDEVKRAYDFLSLKFKASRLIRFEVFDTNNIATVWFEYLKKNNHYNNESYFNNAPFIDSLKNITQKDLEAIVAMPNSAKDIGQTIIKNPDMLNDNGRIHLEKYLLLLNAFIDKEGFNEVSESYFSTAIHFDKTIKDVFKYADKYESNFYNFLYSYTNAYFYRFTDSDARNYQLYKYIAEKPDDRGISIEIIVAAARTNLSECYINTNEGRFELITERYKDVSSLNHYFKWLCRNNPKIRALVVESNEKIKNFNLNFPLQAAKSGVTYPVYFLDDDYITPKIVKVYSTMWEKKSPSVLEPYTYYKDCPKMEKLYQEFLRSRLHEPKYLNTAFKAIEFFSPAEINGYLAKVKQSGIKDLATDSYHSTTLTFLIDALNDTEYFEALNPESLEFLLNMRTTALSVPTYKEHNSEEINNCLCSLFYRIATDTRKHQWFDKLLTKNPEFKKVFYKYTTDNNFFEMVDSEIYGDDLPIKPYKRLNREEIKTLLKINNIIAPKLDTSKANSYGDVLNLRHDPKKYLQDFKIQEVEYDANQLEAMTVEYEHFNTGLESGGRPLRILRVFDVNIPDQQKACASFLKANPKTQIIEPAFHGTSSISAAMVLRYGFRLIDAKTDSNLITAKRRLGDGIYFTQDLDYTAVFINDFSNDTKSTRGYVFEMSAMLGTEGTDYVIEDGDSRSSTEWCVMGGNSQLRIYKAYEVEIMTHGEMLDLKNKHNLHESAAIEIKSFNAFLRESFKPDEHFTTYIFADRTIPVDYNEVIDSSDFNVQSYGDHIHIRQSHYGTLVNIRSKESNNGVFYVKHTPTFANTPEEVNKFLRLLTK